MPLLVGVTCRFFFFFFLARVLLLFWLFCLRATFFLSTISADPLHVRKTAATYTVFSHPPSFSHFSFGLPSVGAVGDVFFYIGVFEHQRRGAFTCVGALLLSSSVPAVSAQSSRL